MSHLIRFYAVCKFSYFRLWHLKYMSSAFVGEILFQLHGNKLRFIN